MTATRTNAEHAPADHAILRLPLRCAQGFGSGQAPAAFWHRRLAQLEGVFIPRGASGVVGVLERLPTPLIADFCQQSGARRMSVASRTAT